MKIRKAIELKEYQDLPYTVVGHTTLIPSFSITLTAKSLKKIAERCKDNEDDLVRITIGQRHIIELITYEDE